MPLYQYKAMNTQGDIVQGRYNGKDQNDILTMLRDNQYYPIKISKVKEEKGLSGIVLFKKIKHKDLAVFARQFHTMLNAGVTIIQCLDILRRQTENKKFANVIDDIYENVQKGETLSEALKRHSQVFPEIFIYMIEAGEASGTLEEIMGRIAVNFEKDIVVQNKIKTAMVYPTALIIITVLVVIFLLTSIFPMFVGMFTGSGMELPGPTRFLLGLSDAIKTYWYIILIATAASIYIVRRFLGTKEGRLTFDNLKLTLPVLKTMLIKIYTSRFTRTLSTLLVSGISLLQAMEIVSKVIGNSVVEKAINDVKDELRQGHDLAGPIKRMELFPPMVDSMIKIGEESGTLDSILDRTADYYDEEVEAAIKKMTSMLEPLLIVVMAVIIGFIVIAMVIPMFDMLNTLQ